MLIVHGVTRVALLLRTEHVVAPFNLEYIISGLNSIINFLLIPSDPASSGSNSDWNSQKNFTQPTSTVDCGAETILAFCICSILL